MKYFLISLLFCSSALSQTNISATNSVPVYIEKSPIRLGMAAHPDYAICIRDLNQSMANKFSIVKQISAINAEAAKRRSLKLPANGESSMIPIYLAKIKNIDDHLDSLRRQEYSMDKAYGIPRAEFREDGKLMERQ